MSTISFAYYIIIMVSITSSPTLSIPKTNKQTKNGLRHERAHQGLFPLHHAPHFLRCSLFKTQMNRDHPVPYSIFPGRPGTGDRSNKLSIPKSYPAACRLFSQTLLNPDSTANPSSPNPHPSSPECSPPPPFVTAVPCPRGEYDRRSNAI